MKQKTIRGWVPMQETEAYTVGLIANMRDGMVYGSKKDCLDDGECAAKRVTITITVEHEETP